MWILVLAKLPTDPSPPKLSMHWSRADGRTEYARRQRQEIEATQSGKSRWREVGLPDPTSRIGRERERAALIEVDEDTTEQEPYFYDSLGFGKVPNWIGARSISYKGQSLRLFPHEYKLLEPERMRGYIFGLGGEAIPSHELVPNTEADAAILGAIKEEDQRIVYDAALCDGCVHEQALLTALGVDLFASGAEIAPIGWYRCKREYAEAFCYEEEMVE